MEIGLLFFLFIEDDDRSNISPVYHQVYSIYVRLDGVIVVS